MIARKGFTLVEVLLVVVIIAILASIVIPRIASSATEASKAGCKATRAVLISAIERYAINHNGTYPADQAAFNALLIDPAYFPHGAPVCPYGTAYVYVSTPGQQTVTAHDHSED